MESRGLSLIGIGVMSAKCCWFVDEGLTSFLHFTGNHKIIKVHINTSLLLATELSIILTSFLTAIQNHVINYCEEW